MFGHAYFGAAYFGPHYWGPSTGAAPAVVVETGTGAGPGWNLFQHGQQKPIDRSRDEIEAEIAEALEDAGSAGKRKRLEIARDVRPVVREAAASPEFAPLAIDLDRLLKAQISADTFLKRLQAIIARQDADARAQILDDEEAFLIMASIS